MRRRNGVESRKVDRLDEHRRAFGDRHREIDLVLLVVELDVEAGDPRVGIAAVGVERLNPLQVRVEARPVEEVFLAPGNFRALAGRERVLQATFVDRLDAFEREAVNLDGASLLAARGQRKDGEGKRDSEDA